MATVASSAIHREHTWSYNGLTFLAFGGQGSISLMPVCMSQAKRRL